MIRHFRSVFHIVLLSIYFTRYVDGMIKKTTHTCDFASGSLCGIWRQDHSDSGDWRHSFTSDYRKPSQQGNVMYTDPGCNNRVDRLLSRKFHEGIVQITLYYKTMSSYGVLKIYKDISGARTQLGNSLTSKSWTFVNVTFNCAKKCEVVLEAVHDHRHTCSNSQILIADVTIAEFEDGVPHVHLAENMTTASGESWYCNFDLDNCSLHWTQDTNDAIDWVYKTGDSGVGRYLLMDASHHRSGEKARLVSDVITPGNVNLTFWYSMYGYDVGALRVFVKDSNGEQLEWERIGDQNTREWLTDSITFSTYLPCRVIFEAEKGVFRHGDIGLDEITLKLSHVMRRSKNHSYEIRDVCDFETEKCGWSQRPKDVIRWERWSGPTPKSNTGPSGDYTTGSGHYALFQDSTSRSNRSAVLTSHVIRRPFWRTLNMAYHMLQYNNQTSRLSVYMRLECNGTRKRVWSNTPTQGVRDWQMLSLSMTSHEPYVLEIEAVAGDRGYGDIGIDNLEIRSGILPEIAICDFQSSFCSWTQRDDDQFDWLLTSGETPTEQTGPSGGGSYAYADASFPRVSGDLAVIESPAIGPLDDQSTCVRFEYNMYGSQVGKLELLQTNKDGGQAQVLWGRAGNQGQDWWPAYVTIRPSAQQFRFQFRAQRKNGIRGDIALRDVTVVGDACHEDAPYDCDFESDMCKWSPASSGSSGNWSFSLTSPSNDSDAAPPNDHTTGSPHGGYMYVSNSPIQATIQTLVTTTHVLCVQFWYFSYGNDNTGAFEFLTQPRDSMATVKWTSYRETVAWQRASITVQSNAKYYMGFRAKAVDGYKAVDDVTVTKGVCA